MCPFTETEALDQGFTHDPADTEYEIRVFKRHKNGVSIRVWIDQSGYAQRATIKNGCVKVALNRRGPHWV